MCNVLLLAVVCLCLIAVCFCADDSWNQKNGNSARSRHSHYFTNHAEWFSHAPLPKNSNVDFNSFLMDPNHAQMMFLIGDQNRTGEYLGVIGVEDGRVSFGQSVIDSSKWERPLVGFVNAVVDATNGYYYVVRRNKLTGGYGVIKMSKTTVQELFLISTVINDLMTVSEDLLLIALEYVVMTIDTRTGELVWIIDNQEKFIGFSQFLLDFRQEEGIVAAGNKLLKFNTQKGRVLQYAQLSQNAPLVGLTSLDTYYIGIVEDASGVSLTAIDKKLFNTSSPVSMWNGKNPKCSNIFAFNNSTNKFGVVCSVKDGMYISKIFQVANGRINQLFETNIESKSCSLSISTLQHGFFGVPCNEGLAILSLDTAQRVDIKLPMPTNSQTQMIGAFHNQYYLTSFIGDEIFTLNGVFPK